MTEIYSGYQEFVGQTPEYEATGAVPPASKLEPTSPDILGPFWLPGSPERKRLCDEPTFTLVGKVMDTDGDPVKALLDFWQADASGVYEEHGPGFRGRQYTEHRSTRGADPEEHYSLQTVKPGYYQIAEHPPDFRCAHIHVKIEAEGHKSLTTQLYFAGTPYDDTDHWFDPKRCVKESADGASATFDFVLAKQ